MTLGNLADNIQAKTETMMSFVGGAALQRLKKFDQGLLIDSGTAVAYLDANISILPDHRDAHRTVRCTIIDCIGDEIPKQLLHPFPVPRPLAVAHDI